MDNFIHLLMTRKQNEKVSYRGKGASGRGVVEVEDAFPSTGLRIVRIQKEFAVVVHDKQFEPTMAAKHITRERLGNGKINH